MGGSGFADRLGGGDRRSIGRSEQVVAEVLAEPRRFGELIDAIVAPDPLVRMRAADAAEKITRRRPELLRRHKERLLGEIAKIDQQEVRWHLAQLIPRLDLSGPERERAIRLLLGYLDDDSRIVKTFAMQALADLAAEDPALRRRVLPILHRLTATGSAAMRSRGRKLLTQLEHPEGGGTES